MFKGVKDERKSLKVDLLEEKKLVRFNIDDNSEYRKLLYSKKDLITYHK